MPNPMGGAVVWPVPRLASVSAGPWGRPTPSKDSRGRLCAWRGPPRRFSANLSNFQPIFERERGAPKNPALLLVPPPVTHSMHSSRRCHVTLPSGVFSQVPRESAVQPPSIPAPPSLVQHRIAGLRTAPSLAVVGHTAPQRGRSARSLDPPTASPDGPHVPCQRLPGKGWRGLSGRRDAGQHRDRTQAGPTPLRARRTAARSANGPNRPGTNIPVTRRKVAVGLAARPCA